MTSIDADGDGLPRTAPEVGAHVADVGPFLLVRDNRGSGIRTYTVDELLALVGVGDFVYHAVSSGDLPHYADDSTGVHSLVTHFTDDYDSQPGGVFDVDSSTGTIELLVDGLFWSGFGANFDATEPGPSVSLGGVAGNPFSGGPRFTSAVAADSAYSSAPIMFRGFAGDVLSLVVTSGGGGSDFWQATYAEVFVQKIGA